MLSIPETQQMLREKIVDFRCVELRECLQVLNVPYSKMRKSMMVSTLLNYIDSSAAYRNLPSFPKFVLAVFACDERLKAKREKRQKRRKKVNPMTVTTLLCRKNKFFETLKTLRTTRMKRSSGENGLEKTVQFIIPSDFTTLLLKKIRPQSKVTYEVQLLLEDQNNEMWVPTDVDYIVNGKHRKRMKESPAIIYLPIDILKIRGDINTIYVKLNFMEHTEHTVDLTISIVRRYSPSAIMKEYPIAEVNRLEELILKYFKETGRGVYEVTIICPIENQLMQYPCRSKLCSHPDVFDLETFLKQAQYCLKWRCLICSKHITLESLELETFFQQKERQGKFNFTFFNKAATPRDAQDSEVVYDHECIILD